MDLFTFFSQFATSATSILSWHQKYTWWISTWDLEDQKRKSSYSANTAADLSSWGTSEYVSFKNWLSYIDPLTRNSRYKHYNANCNSSWHNQWATSQFTRYQYMKYMGFWRIHLGLKYLKLWSWIPQGYDSYFNN